MAFIQKHFDELDKHLADIESLNRVEEVLVKKGLKKSQLLVVIILILLALVFFDIGAAFITNFIAFIFPAYSSIRALQTENKEDDAQWLAYWVVFSLTVVVENFLFSVIAENLALFYIIKFIFCIWLMYPGTRGAELIYEHAILNIPALRIKSKNGDRDVKSTFARFMESVTGKGLAARGSEEYDEQASSSVPSIVRMFSGCMDEQTSADVHDTGSFGVSAELGPSGAGGACTNSFLLAMENKPNCSWGHLLSDMRDILEKKKYTQVPQLSSSRDFRLKSDFTLINPLEAEKQGRRKALLIGINYIGTKAELKGCINDVEKLKSFLEMNGFEDFKVLTDETPKTPTVENIVAGIAWLVKDAKAGDSLFMHFSGHGGRIPDDDNDEHDGYDETMVPLDYTTKGQIRDDDLFKILIAPLPEGCHMTVMMDCCHSGSILDLPFTIKANGRGMQSLDGEDAHLGQNPRFSLSHMFSLVKNLLGRSKEHQERAAEAVDSNSADVFGIYKAALEKEHAD